MGYELSVGVRSLTVMLVTAGAVLATTACGAGDSGGASEHDAGVRTALAVTPAAAQTASVGTVDSIFPMDVMIERFQAEAGDRPAGLTGAAKSRDELVQAFVAAVEDSSTAALRALRMDMAEYAYLYVPTSHLSLDPYRQPPAIGWMLTEQNGLKGETRLIRRFGGRPLGFRGYDCPEAAVIEGDNRLWRNCVVDAAAGGEPVRLFGTIMERSGAFKFISIANDL